jgi:hypothetical protein
VCGARINVFSERLISAQWVDTPTGALITMQFHSACYVRWYQETASTRASRGEPADAGRERGSGTAAPETQGGIQGAEQEEAQAETPALPAPPSAPEVYLTPAERRRLEELRRRRGDAEGRATRRPSEGVQGAPEQRSGSAPDGEEPGQELGDQGVGEDDQAPQKE